MILISENDVERLIEPKAAIAAVADCFRRQAAASGVAHGRLDLPRYDPNGSVLVLAGHAENGLFAAKTNVHVYPDSQSRRRLAQSMMMLWDSVACRPLALIATTAFNNHRTGAGLAVAADLLAPQDARTLTVFGAGKIASAVIQYLAAVRSFKQIFILGHGSARARELAATIAQWSALAHSTVSADIDPEQAVREADIVVTITTSSTPVFSGQWVKPGALVILAGANRPDSREADDVLIGRAQVYADHMDGCMSRAGDIKLPFASGHLKPDQIAGDIGNVVGSTLTAKCAGTDVTVFKSMGIIGQDIAIAALLLERARVQCAGVVFDPQSGDCLQPIANTQSGRFATVDSRETMP